MGVIRLAALQCSNHKQHNTDPLKPRKSCVDFIGIIYVLLRQEGLSSS
jgi:hypothetical protein